MNNNTVEAQLTSPLELRAFCQIQWKNVQCPSLQGTDMPNSFQDSTQISITKLETNKNKGLTFNHRI